MNHNPFHFYEAEKNETLVVKLCFPLNKEEHSYMRAFAERMDLILNSGYQQGNGLRVLCEGEQSNVQDAVEDIQAQL